MWRIFKTAALVVLALVTLFVVYEVFTFPQVSELRTKNPETTSMIEQRAKEAREQGREPRRVQQWVPLDRISINLQRAVLAGEDTNFVAHQLELAYREDVAFAYVRVVTRGVRDAHRIAFSVQQSAFSFNSYPTRPVNSKQRTQVARKAERRLLSVESF